jgi:hypothetical protein
MALPMTGNFATADRAVNSNFRERWRKSFPTGLTSRTFLHRQGVVIGLNATTRGGRAISRFRSGARARRDFRRLLVPISRSSGRGALGGGPGTTSRISTRGARVAGASRDARNARPESVICHPASSRNTNRDLKTSRSGARAARRFIRFAQSAPLETRIPTSRLRSARVARPRGCAAKTFRIVS